MDDAKGQVESGVKYVKNTFVPLKEFRSLLDANIQLKAWVMEVAGNRTHGTTRQKPLTLFAETEKHFLNPLPDIPPEPAIWTRVKLHGNCHIQFKKAQYSAPYQLVHRELWLKATDSTVKLYHNLELVAVHPRLTKAGARATVRDHYPPEAVAYLMQDPQYCLKEAETVGPLCHRFVQELFSHRVLDNLRAAQGVLKLKKQYGNRRLESACQRALFFGDIRYQALKTILAKGLDQLPLSGADQPLSPSYSSGRFVRTGAELTVH